MPGGLQVSLSMKKYLKEIVDFSVPAGRIAYRLEWGDWLFAFLAGLGVLLLSFAWPYPVLHPDVWQETAAAAGLRPPEMVQGGVWRGLAGLLFETCGSEAAQTVLRALGKVAGAACASCVYLILRSVLPRHLDITLRSYLRHQWLVRAILALGAFLFGCSEPVWRVFQQFGPEALTVLSSVLAVTLLYRFFQGSGRWVLFLSFFLAGVLTAESLAGLALGAFLVVALVRAQYQELAETHPLFNPLTMQRLKWQLSFVYLLALAGAVAYDFTSFLQADGLAATGLETPAFVVRYLTDWGKLAVALATPVGWAFATLVVIAPCLLSVALMRRATSMEKFLPLEVAGFFVLFGVAALLQLSGFSKGWFWTWVKFPPMIGSGVLGAFFMFMCTVTGVFSLVVLAVDFWCRNYQLVAVRLYSDPALEAEMHEDGSSLAVVPRAFRLLRVGLVVLMVVVLLGGTVWGRHKVTTRRLLGLMDEFVAETVRECAGAHWVFTDGSFDPLIELRSAASGHPLAPLSMMASKGAYDAFLRTRSARDKEDRAVFETSVLQAFRLWAESKPLRMKETAFQLGFEAWRRREKEMPLCLGVVATGAEVPPEEVARATEAAHVLAGRIIGLYTDAGARGLDCPDGEILRLFECAQWRLARLAQQRAGAHDRAGDLALTAAEKGLMDKLDEQNVSFGEIKKKVEGLQKQTNPILTPREGLGIALRRNDFIMARRYALPILNAEPDDPHANYAIGMSHFVEERWGQAVRFLARVLEKMPNESTVMNNMAVAYWKDGKFKEALEWGEKALEASPEATEVKENLAHIRKDYEAYQQKKAAEDAKQDQNL